VDRNLNTLSAERLELLANLTIVNSGVRIRPLFAYDPIDGSNFYAEDGVREFFVSVIEDVTWGPDISHYVEEADDFRLLRRMSIDVPNNLGGHVTAVRKLFIEWFNLNDRPVLRR
jgi:hypothetical protein